MDRGRALAIALVGVTLVCALVSTWSFAAGAPSKASADRGDDLYVAGYYSVDESITLAYRTVTYGEYDLGYSMEVRLTTSDASTVLECGWVDPNFVIGYLDSSPREVVAALGTATPLAFTGFFQLPNVTIALRCSPSQTGELSAQFSNVELAITPR